MSLFNQGYPNVAYFIEDKNNLGNRVPFKCRVVEESPQFYTQVAGGIADIGTNLTLITWKKFQFKQGAKVLFNEVLYSIDSIVPFIADTSRQGFTKAKIDAEYLLRLV